MIRRLPTRPMALLLFLCLTALCANRAFGQSVPVKMNFQGRLARPDGTPVPDNAAQPLTFRLFSAVSGGAPLWSQTGNVAVHNGVFSVALDFSTGFVMGQSLGSVFASSPYLEIQVSSDAPLTPRQPYASVAYALFAGTALSALSVPDSSVTGAKIASGTITQDKLAFSISGSGWSLTGNAGIDESLDFLGTTDNKPLILKVNGQQAMRYSYAENAVYRSINVLGGSGINSIGAGVVGATIAGGGWDFPNSPDNPNQVNADFGTVGGGGGNTGSGFSSVIAGGFGNIASGDYSTIAGGISGGAFGLMSTVGGGGANHALGDYATAPGGSANNAAGNYSFAAGQQAQANHNGSFVWNDASNTVYPTPFASTGANQFLINASGGVGINKNNPAAGTLDVNGSIFMTGFKLATGAGAGKTLVSDANGMGTWGQIGTAGIAANAITADKLASDVIGMIGWSTTGNAGLDSSINFLGTKDNQPLAFRVDNSETMRLLPNGNVGIGTQSPVGLLQVGNTMPSRPEALDQQQTTYNISAGGNFIWQSFTAAATGLLTRLDLRLGSPRYDAPAPGILYIHPGEGTGQSALTTQNIMILPQYDTFQTFILAAPVYITAGQTYTYHIETPDFNNSWAPAAGGDPYPAGRSDFQIAVDYLFKTYVTPIGSGATLMVKNGIGVGIDTINPAASLDVNGNVFMTGFKMTTGASTGQVLTSDANGVGTWQPPTSGGNAGGDLTGAYPNPTIAGSAVTSGKLAYDSNSLERVSGGQILVLANGNVGIGAYNSDVKLNVGGTVHMMGFSLTGGQAGKVLTSDASGVGTWQSLSLAGITAGGALSGTYPNPSLASNAVTTANIADGSVTAAKIAAGVLPTALPPNGAAGGDLTGTYPNPTITANAVTTAKIADGSITNTKLASDAASLAKVSGGVLSSSGGSLSSTGTLSVPSANIASFNLDQRFGALAVGGGFVVDKNGNNNGNNGDPILYLGSIGGEGIGSNHALENLDFYTGFMHRMTITLGGYVGIGTQTPAYRLELPNTNSNDGKGRANAWVTYSSGRWKNHITPIDNALDKVLTMRGVMFDWLPEYGGGHDIGFVAEEVGAVVPELAVWEKDGKFAQGLKYDRVTALLVEAVKTLSNRVDEKKKEVEELKTKVAALEAQNETLKKQTAEIAELKTQLAALAAMKAPQNATAAGK